MNGFLAAAAARRKCSLAWSRGVGSVPFAGLGARHESHIHGNFHLQNVHGVLGLGEFLHAVGYDFGFLSRVPETLFIGALFVTDQFQKERHVRRGAFAADALDPGVLGLH